MLVKALVSALTNLIVLALLPFLGYFGYQKWRQKRSLGEVAKRVGLQLGEPRFIGYSLAFATVSVTALAVWSPPLRPFLREGSPQKDFEGLGLSGEAIAMALLYGMVKTGFAEEVLFRGLIGGSLARRLPPIPANVAQASIFLIPHLLILQVMPEMWGILPVIFTGALFIGWVRIESDSIIGPWLIHGALNTTICLDIAARTAG